MSEPTREEMDAMARAEVERSARIALKSAVVVGGLPFIVGQVLKINGLGFRVSYVHEGKQRVTLEPVPVVRS